MPTNGASRIRQTRLYGLVDCSVLDGQRLRQERIHEKRRVSFSRSFERKVKTTRLPPPKRWEVTLDVFWQLHWEFAC